MDRLISEQAVINAIDKWVKSEGVLIALPATKVTPLFDSIHNLPPVNPQPQMGCKGCIHEKTGNNSTYPCSHCSRCYTDKYKIESEK